MGEIEIDFDLASLTRKVIGTRDAWSAGELADAVLAATPRNRTRHAYRQALGAYVRQALGNAPADPRLGQMVSDIHASSAEAGTTPDAADQAGIDDQRAHVGSVGAPSARLALFRAAGFRGLIHAGPNAYKPLIDCSVDELLFAASESDQHAQANAAAAERYRKLVKLMREYNADTPAELPESVLEETFAS